MLQIVEIVTRTVQGMTAPMICRADDDRLYVVKGRDALNRGLISDMSVPGSDKHLVCPYRISP
jgi:hypothetical protein